MINVRANFSHVPARWALRRGALLLAWTTAWGQTPLPQAASAAEALSVNADQQTTTKELRALTDPTILQRRFWLETEWDSYRGGTHGVEETLGGVWAWRLSTNLDFGVRLKLPYEWRMTGGPGSALEDQGLGDLKLGGVTAIKLSHTWRTAVGLELRMPTAADNLGGRDWRLQEYGAVAWDATRWLTVSPNFEYNESLAEVDNARPQHYLEVFFPATFVLPHHWSVTPRYEAKVDFERNNTLVQSLRLQVAKQFNKPPLGLALAIKKPFYNGPLENGVKEFQVNFIITYYIR
jgi:hypothetical protein